MQDGEQRHARDHEPEGAALQAWALAGFEIFTIVMLTIILLLGHENHGRSFYSGDDLLIERD